MKTPLLWKLVFVQVPGITAAIALIWLAIDYLAADYFSSLMERYNVSPRESHQMFLDAIHRYLIGASLLALLLGSVMSYLLTRRVLDPLSEMIRVTQAIAHGDYSKRLAARSTDEVGQLAAAFNRMADNLEEIERMRRELIADVAHELRTPLTNIRGYLEALRDGVLQPDHTRLNMLHEQALQLVQLTESLLELARADAAHLTIHFEWLDMRPLIDEVTSLLAPTMERRGLTLKVAVQSGAERVMADSRRLRQVLRNLLENAVTYAAENGRVSIRVRRIVKGVRVEVANDGIPISADDLPHLFERFYRGDKSRSRVKGGAGIGLAIVKELVAAHGGDVGANSAEGRTQFWFTLPEASGGAG